MEEFFLEGDAARYELAGGSSYSPDGLWEAREAGAAPFRTRFLVVRPRDPATFNGTVLATWLNVTGGSEYDTITSEEVFEGFAWVAVSAQHVGVEGFPEGFEYTGRQIPKPPLKRWDPERYGTLNHPGDAYSFDIFTQVGRAIGPSREGSSDPLGGLVVQRVVATGASQSALRLMTYLNAVQPLTRGFDGFLMTVTPGWAVPLADPPSMFETHARADVDVPVMIVNSEWEAINMLSVRNNDSDRFRFWEVAGAPHAVALPDASVPRTDDRLDNPLPILPVTSAAYRAMHRWLADGAAPPTAPRIEFTSDTPPVIARDERGNALGGLRLPELVAPLAEYRGRDEDAADVLKSLYGWSRQFTKDEVRSLYSSDEDYRSRYLAAVAALVEEGFLLRRDADAMAARAADVTLDLA